VIFISPGIELSAPFFTPLLSQPAKPFSRVKTNKANIMQSP